MPRRILRMLTPLALLAMTAGVAIGGPGVGRTLSSRTPGSPAHDPALVGLKDRLEGPVKKMQPAATVAFADLEGNDTIQAQYQTQEFLVYLRDMRGRISSKPVRELGPNYEGFLLRAYTAPASFHSQAVPGHVWHEPYWDTEFDVFRLKHPSECLCVTLSYGSRTDRNLIASINKIVADYAAKR